MRTAVLILIVALVWSPFIAFIVADLHAWLKAKREDRDEQRLLDLVPNKEEE